MNIQFEFVEKKLSKYINQMTSFAVHEVVHTVTTVAM